jgi:hypothetical protein
MTRYQLPDTPEDIRRAKRAPIVALLFAASLCVGAMLMHPTFRTALGENLSRAPLHAEPIAVLIVPDEIPMLLPTIAPDALDVRACAGNPECDPQYYEPGVR